MRHTSIALLVGALAILGAAGCAETPSASELHVAVRRALRPLEHSAATFVAERSCMSCHHNALAVLTFRLAKSRGFAIDDAVLRDVEETTFRELRHPGALDEAIQGTSLSDPTPNQSYLLMAAHAAGVAPSLTTGVYARRMARWQRDDGHWVTSDFRPPHSSSVVTATATAVRALMAYMPEALAGDRDAAVARAVRWLRDTPPASTEDASFRVMGLAWAGADGDALSAAVDDLVALQRPDGGWGQLPWYDPDAYSTGEALVALGEAGVPPSDPVWRKGLSFLVSTQAPDGTWHVKTRMISPATVSPPYFETGFPYEQDQFLSYTGSSWAVMALVSALPGTALDEPPAEASLAAPAAVEAVGVAPWVRTALFGTADALRALLDQGLDPGSRTKGGSTLLMMAAAEPDKLRVLTGRGADVRERTEQGADAVSAAASYGGASEAIGVLLDAGGAPAPPAGVALRRSPLVLAAMTGDASTAALLLARGAEPTVEALAEAVTFGHADVAQLLVDAGVEVNVTESSGINLVHWATITNRASVIPVLVGAGADINATDESGFTPLMYAATIDFGDVETLKTLLSSGADRAVPNNDGRTPLEQARSLGLTHLATALQ